MSGLPALLIDLGNSRTKWALLDGAGPRSSGTAPHAVAGLGGEIAESLVGLPAPARILVGSVAGADREEALRSLCRELWNREPLFVSSEPEAAGVISGYHSPDQLGVDRWLALLAAHADGRGDACVLDCGTAVTIDLVDAAGRHHGGLILPGLRAMRECLLQRTRIPPFGEVVARAALGRETADAVANGALLAVVGAVRETLRNAQELLGRVPRLLIAGGDGPVLAEALGEAAELRPDLVLEGLAVLARRDDS